jgi:hypothetical protein
VRKLYHHQKTCYTQCWWKNGEAETNLTDFSGNRNSYATYCLRSTPGNHFRHGSVAAEINHPSVLCYLNVTPVVTNTYCKSPLVLCKDLMKRQSQHVKLTNERFFERAQPMRTERKKG